MTSANLNLQRPFDNCTAFEGVCGSDRVDDFRRTLPLAIVSAKFTLGVGSVEEVDVFRWTSNHARFVEGDVLLRRFDLRTWSLYGFVQSIAFFRSHTAALEVLKVGKRRLKIKLLKALMKMRF